MLERMDWYFYNHHQVDNQGREVWNRSELLTPGFERLIDQCEVVFLEGVFRSENSQIGDLIENRWNDYIAGKTEFCPQIEYTGEEIFAGLAPFMRGKGKSFLSEKYVAQFTVSNNYLQARLAFLNFDLNIVEAAFKSILPRIAKEHSEREKRISDIADSIDRPALGIFGILHQFLPGVEKGRTYFPLAKYPESKEAILLQRFKKEGIFDRDLWLWVGMHDATYACLRNGQLEHLQAYFMADEYARRSSPEMVEGFQQRLVAGIRRNRLPFGLLIDYADEAGLPLPLEMEALISSRMSN